MEWREYLDGSVAEERANARRAWGSTGSAQNRVLGWSRPVKGLSAGRCLVGFSPWPRD